MTRNYRLTDFHSPFSNFCVESTKYFFVHNFFLSETESANSFFKTHKKVVVTLVRRRLAHCSKFFKIVKAINFCALSIRKCIKCGSVSVCLQKTGEIVAIIINNPQINGFDSSSCYLFFSYCIDFDGSKTGVEEKKLYLNEFVLTRWTLYVRSGSIFYSQIVTGWINSNIHRLWPYFRYFFRVFETLGPEEMPFKLFPVWNGSKWARNRYGFRKRLYLCCGNLDAKKFAVGKFELFFCFYKGRKLQLWRFFTDKKQQKLYSKFLKG